MKYTTSEHIIVKCTVGLLLLNCIYKYTSVSNGKRHSHIDHVLID